MAGWRRLEGVALGSHTGVKDGFALRAFVCSFRSLEEIVLPVSSVLEACLGNQVHKKVYDLYSMVIRESYDHSESGVSALLSQNTWAAKRIMIL